MSAICEEFQYLMDIDAQGQSALSWAQDNQGEIEALLQQQGALLIRGLTIPSSKMFGKVLCALFDDELLEYTYRSTPRTEVKGNVYTATEYHNEQVISQHNENAYSNKWALRIGFLCMHPADVGGQTPIADSRAIYKDIPKEIRDEFEAKDIKYVRNYSDVDLPWTEVFCTEERGEVEIYCQKNNLKYEWVGENGLRTTQVNPASQVHPIIGDKVWFNQAHLFHVSNLQAEIAQTLLASVGEEHLPRNAYFGDGSPIDPEHLAIIRQIIVSHKVSFDWQKNDLMLLDNMLFTHGREPFEGQRKVLVGMAKLVGSY